jgi:hypothetical protein
VEVRRGSQPVLLARLRGVSAGAEGTEISAPFTDRLVAKFDLPVTGWRGKGDRRQAAHGPTAAPQEAAAAPSETTAARQRDEEPGGDA